MKLHSQLQKYLAIFLLAVSIIISLSVAFYLYRQYSVVARGISGIALAHLMFYFGKHSNLDATLDELYSENNKIKYIVSALIIPLLGYFASLQIYEMVIFILRK